VSHRGTKETGVGIAVSTTLAASLFTLSNRAGIQMHTLLTIVMGTTNTMVIMDIMVNGMTNAERWKITAMTN